MDQKRIIVIVIVVATVVIGTIFIAWWQFFPKPDTAHTATQSVLDPKAASASSNPSGPSGTPTPSGTPGPNGNVSNGHQEVVIVYGTNSAYANVNGKTVQIAPTGSPLPNAQTGVTPVPSASPAQVAVENTKTPGPAATTKTPSAKPLTSKKTASAAPNEKTREFWIQIVSLPSRDKVEVIKKDMAARGWNGRITMIRKGGADFYRLRYGPFDQKAEGEKFLAWIKDVPEFKDSYLVEENQQRSIAPRPANKK